MRLEAPESRSAFAWLLWLAAACASPSAPDPEAAPVPRADHRLAGTARATPEARAAAAEPGGEHPDEPEPDLIPDDEEELEPTPLDPLGATQARAPHPLEGWSAERLRAAVKNELATLGPMSLGQPSAGALLNGVQAESSALYELVAPSGAWGTRETIDYLAAALNKVHAVHPETPPLSLGHISAQHGGPLRPHLSHQSGRDVDISFYYLDGTRWYARATEKNLDRARTWTFVRALVTETDVEMILIDHSVQALLRRHALESGEDPAWVSGIFDGVAGKLRPIVRHAPGHATHLHVRFYNPIAQESARLAYEALVQEGIAPRLTSFVRHRARRGDTLGKLARKYGTSVRAIQQANGLRTKLLRERREYRIPIRGGRPAVAAEPLKLPQRRLPPP